MKRKLLSEIIGRWKMFNIIAVGAGGFIGAVLRYLVGLIPVNENFIFPIKTFAINVVGCIAIGIITVAASKTGALSQHMTLFLKVGLCGGFTTFSTFALESGELIKAGHSVVALMYMMLSFAAGVIAIFAAEYFVAIR